VWYSGFLFPNELHMDPRISQIVAREMPNAIIVEPESVAVSQVEAKSPMLESERLLRKKYGPASITPVVEDSTAMAIVEHPTGRRETLVIDLSTQTVIATSG